MVSIIMIKFTLQKLSFSTPRTHRIIVVPLHMVLNKEWQMQVLACAHA